MKWKEKNGTNLANFIKALVEHHNKTLEILNNSSILYRDLIELLRKHDNLDPGGYTERQF